MLPDIRTEVSASAAQAEGDGAPSATDVRRAAMDLLARREHSFQELTEKLQRRFYRTPLIAEVLQRLREEGLQSDVRFAEAYVHSRALRLYGPSRIRLELRERRVSEEAIEHALDTAGIDWALRLDDLIRRKFGRKPAADIAERARRQRFIAYRGFNQFRLADGVESDEPGLSGR
jgi:regulatory protein